MLSLFRRLIPPPPPTPEPPAPAAPARPEVPRYPPFLQGLPVVASPDLLATQDELMHKLRYGIGCTSPFFEANVRPVVDRYAAFVHLLPASEAHHHRGAGGLLHHGLEVAFFAAQASHGKVFAYDREPKVRRVHEPLWRLAAGLAGLCHDIGKPVSDLSVTDRDGTRVWSPIQETIPEWAGRHGIDSYFLHWRDRRHNRHESAGMMVLERVLGSAAIAMLYDADPEILNALIDAAAGQNEGAILSRLVADADRASVERDLKANRIDPQATALGVPIERYLLDAMSRLVRSGAWRVNVPGGRLWMLPGGLHVVWPAGGDEIAALLAADRVPGIPRHPDTLADLLIERGHAIPPHDGDCKCRYWRLAPAPLARAGQPVTLVLLRLTSPQLVLSGPTPAPVALCSDASARAAVPAQAQPRQRPDARSQAISGPFTIDRATASDAEPDSLDLAGSQDERAAVRTLPVDPAPSAAPDNPRADALAWLRSCRPGAGARLLLAVAESIRTGERAPETVLYLAGGQAWLRFPAGLEGFGAPIENQIDALWDDHLLAVDILKPLLRVREIDGIRAVSLKAEPSSHFVALLPTEALERCRKPPQVSTDPDTAEQPSASPSDPASTAHPRPTRATPPATANELTMPAASSLPRVASAAATLSPGAVADALLAQVRAKHSCTIGSGATLMIEAAAIAAAAQNAGLRPQAVHLALLHRPGCAAGSDGGIEVAAPDGGKNPQRPGCAP